MHARDRAEAVEVLNLLLKFFGDGERWIKGHFRREGAARSLSEWRGLCQVAGGPSPRNAG
jgi:hypothetical protein